jgi:hypothetical protein
MDIRIIAGVIAVGVAYWVYNDARKWGYNNNAALGWAVGVFLLMIVFLPLYVIIELKRARRQLEPTGAKQSVGISTSCEFCRKQYLGNPTYCPHCGHLVRKIN